MVSNEDFSTKNYLFYARKSLPLQSNFLAHKRYFLEREILIERQKGVDEIMSYFLDFNTCKLNKHFFCFRNIYLNAIVPDVWIHMILEPMEIHYCANNVLMESIVHPLGNVINVNLNEIYPYK